MLDLIIITIVAIFLLLGFVRGFLREFFGLLGVVISVVITLHNYDIWIVLFNIERSVFTHLVSTFVTYIMVIIIIIILNNMLMSAIKAIRHNNIDSIFGLFLGGVKGFILSYMMVFFIQLFYFSLYVDSVEYEKKKESMLPKWLVSSHVYPVFNYVDLMLDSIIPDDLYDDIKAFSYSLSESMEKDVKDKGSNKKQTKIKNQLRS